jgi:hypothetical protein
MSARHDSAAARVPGAAAFACMLCGGTNGVPHFPGRETALPISPVSERYRITHSERRLVHAILRLSLIHI